MFNKHYSMIVIMMIAMLAAPIVGATQIYQEVEIRASVADGNETYDYRSFAGFWFDLNKNQSSETMDITVSGTDNRTIKEGDLVYNCTPQSVEYKNDDLNAEYGRYMLIGFMADEYICYDNKVDKLVKLLIEWGSSDEMVLSIDDSMELPDGYRLTAAEIDLAGDRTWIKLYKDSECIDDSIVFGGDTYIYEDADDVLLFSAQIESVFRGTESNLVVVKYIFLRSDEILEVRSGDSFGVMEVKGTSGSIVLENDDVLTLDADSEIDIMNGLYFKVADNDTALRYYLAKTVSLECPECPSCPELVPAEPCPECPEPVNATMLEPEAKPTKSPIETPTEQDDDNGGTLPGFEGVMALTGLLAVAFLVLKQRD